MSHAKRQPRPATPARFLPMLASYDLALQSEGRAARTRRTRRDAAGWFAASLPDAVREWSDVTHLHVRAFLAGMAEHGYSRNYVNNVARSLQAFFGWHAAEESVPNPFDRVKVPGPRRLGDDPPPVLALEQLAELLRSCEAGRSYRDRRDAAILRLFACTGCRLAEIANLRLADVDLPAREITVTGKAAKTRTVRIDHKAALAVDRYLRARAKHPAAELAALWIGERRRVGMTPDGVYHMVQRRGAALGLRIHPHLFRHTFAHRWLDAGGTEGDLMQLAGWDSPQMLRLYGASARGARARRAYDRIDVMSGV